MKLAYTIDELVEAGPLGRTSLYAAISRGELVAKKYGRKTFITAEDFRRFLAERPAIPAKDQAA